MTKTKMKKLDGYIEQGIVLAKNLHAQQAKAAKLAKTSDIINTIMKQINPSEEGGRKWEQHLQKRRELLERIVVGLRKVFKMSNTEHEDLKKLVEKA